MSTLSGDKQLIPGMPGSPSDRPVGANFACMSFAVATLSSTSAFIMLTTALLASFLPDMMLAFAASSLAFAFSWAFFITSSAFSTVSRFASSGESVASLSCF